ncbi:MAG: T9SS type A sorting domain-containing protein [Bacteroidia bacterium]
MKKILLLFSCFAFVNANAQYVTIPDANFVTYLQTIIPAAMNGNQMDTTHTLVTTTTQTINVSNSTITDLTGITYFKSLKYLDCSMLFLNVPLPILPAGLTHLNCNMTENIGAPAILPNSLSYLDCSQAQLTLDSLPRSLDTLKASFLFSQWTSVPPLPDSLKYLDIEGNYIAVNIPWFPPTLTCLNADNNKFTCFPTFPSSLVVVQIHGNMYDCLPNYILPAMTWDYYNTPLCGPGNANGCPAVTTGMKLNEIKTVSIYPNPASTVFFIEANATEKVDISMFDVNGNLVLNRFVEGKASVDVAALNEGVYSVTIKARNGLENKRLVILH